MTTTSRSRPSTPAALGPDVAAVREGDPLDLVEVLAALTHEDLEAMSAAQAEVVVAATQRAASALAAIQAAAVTTYADRVDEDLERYRQERRRDLEERRDAALAAGVTFTERWYPVPGEASFAAAGLAPLLHVSPRTMAARITRSRRLDHEMSATWARARSGDLEPYRTDAVVRGGAPLEGEALEEFEARLYAEDVADLSTGELAERARRAATATDRVAVEEVATRAREKRAVTCRPDRDLPGMASWRLSLPSEPSRRVWSAVDELAREYHRARRDTRDPVTLDQARADAIVDLVLGRATVETTVELVVPVAALLGEGGGGARADGAGVTGGTARAGGATGDDRHGVTRRAGAGGARPDGTGLAGAGTGAGIAVPSGDDHSALDGDRGPTRVGAGTYRWAERRTPAEILAGDGVTDEVILRWVSGEELHRASCFEAEYALLLAGHLDVVGNPHLRHPPPPHGMLLLQGDGPPPGAGPPHGADPANHADRAHRALAHSADPAGDASPPRGADPARGSGASQSPAAPGGVHGAGAGPSGPTAWFVPGHVDHSRVGALLPDDLAGLLANPTTRIRVAGSDASTGAATTDSTAAYRPAGSVVRRVRRRDGTCRFPGCATPAERCQLDHVIPWPDGPTEDANLACLCTSHHGFKHHAGWRLSMTSAGVCTWTAPTGRTHMTRPRAAHSASV